MPEERAYAGADQHGHGKAPAERYGRGLWTFGVTAAVLLDGSRRLSRPVRTKENFVVGLGPAAVELGDLSNIVRHTSPTLLLMRNTFSSCPGSSWRLEQGVS